MGKEEEEKEGGEEDWICTYFPSFGDGWDFLHFYFLFLFYIFLLLFIDFSFQTGMRATLFLFIYFYILFSVGDRR